MVFSFFLVDKSLVDFFPPLEIGVWLLCGNSLSFSFSFNIVVFHPYVRMCVSFVLPVSVIGRFLGCFSTCHVLCDGIALLPTSFFSWFLTMNSFWGNCGRRRDGDGMNVCRRMGTLCYRNRNCYFIYLLCSGRCTYILLVPIVCLAHRGCACICTYNTHCAYARFIAALRTVLAPRR